ncbi:uncharacterized protein PG986_005735 [Apiospora aurea]|uniref:Uncharacterized protein n=1 Tax=Apiospora aurea TaxID=335848 RepID=A0ABR1QIE9_9PEZI
MSASKGRGDSGFTMRDFPQHSYGLVDAGVIEHGAPTVDIPLSQAYGSLRSRGWNRLHRNCHRVWLLERQGRDGTVGVVGPQVRAIGEVLSIDKAAGKA